MPSLRELVVELRVDALSAKGVPALSAGLTSGLGLLVAQIAFGTFIFSGALAPYSSQGVGLILFGNFATCVLVALVSGYRGVIAGLSPALVIPMALLAGTTPAEGDALFVSAVGLLVTGAVITGACCLLIGRFRLANLVRFIPYPVAGGFVAGIGGAVCIAAMSLMGAELDGRAVTTLFAPAVFWQWVPGVVYGIALYLSVRRWGNALILPVSVALFVVAYHGVLAALDIPGEAARASGLLLTSTADGVLWPALRLSDLTHLDWAAMAVQLPLLLGLMLIALISVIMNIAGLELAVNQDLDWDREFRASGLASVLAGLGGGTVATAVVPASFRSKLFGATTRLTGLVAAAVIGSALLLGDGMLELVPAPLVGGILVFAGLGMLDEGLLRSYRRLPWSEYSIIVLIFATIVSFGLLEGVGAGMLATLVFFAVRLSRVDPIESRFTARERQSSRARPVPDRAILLQDGGRVHAYRLRGYLFFGSVCPLADHLRQSVSSEQRPACLILDFRQVSGFDFSAVSVLCRCLQTAEAAGVRIVLSALPKGLLDGLRRNLRPPVFAALIVEPAMDPALERSEDIIIDEWKTDTEAQEARRSALLAATSEDLERYLDRQIQFEDLTAELKLWASARAYAAGETLAGPDAAEGDLQLIVSGRASAFDSAGARLHQCGPGDAIWLASALQGKVASVVADEACRTMALTPDGRQWLERQEKPLVLQLYRYLLAGSFRSA